MWQIIIAIVGLALLAMVARHMATLGKAVDGSTIVVVKRKDSDMKSIKDRLAALEAALASKDVSASAGDVAALAERVSQIEADIGSDPAPELALAADPALIDPAPAA